MYILPHPQQLPHKNHTKTQQQIIVPTNPLKSVQKLDVSNMVMKIFIWRENFEEMVYAVDYVGWSGREEVIQK